MGDPPQPDRSSTAISDLVGLRPKLRQDAVILFDGGAFLRNGEGGFVLRGEHVFRWLSALSRHLNGTSTVEQLCGGLAPAQRDTVTRLLATLFERGLVIDRRGGPEPLPEDVADRFRQQLAFIEHYADGPERRFLAFRGSRVLLVGDGETGAAVGQGLLRNGLAHLHVAPTDGPGRGLDVLRREAARITASGTGARVEDVALDSGAVTTFDRVVYCPDRSDLRAAVALDAQCRDAGVRFLPVLTTAGRVVFGPMTRPPEGPCLTCALLRLSAASDAVEAADLWREVAVGPSAHRRTVPPALARMIGNAVAFELFSSLVGNLPCDAESAVVVQDLDTLVSDREELVAHPLCPVCSEDDPERAVKELGELFAEETAPSDDADEMKAAERQYSRLVGRTVGLFSGWDDEWLRQTPVKVALLRTGPPGADPARTPGVAAASVESVLHARQAVMRRAADAYVSALPNIRRMPLATTDELVHRRETTKSPGDPPSFAAPSIRRSTAAVTNLSRSAANRYASRRAARSRPAHRRGGGPAGLTQPTTPCRSWRARPSPQASSRRCRSPGSRVRSRAPRHSSICTSELALKIGTNAASAPTSQASTT